jgi:hypothetical protein
MLYRTEESETATQTAGLIMCIQARAAIYSSEFFAASPISFFFHFII